jgi:hypothetical protein
MPNLITADIAVEVIYTATPGQTVFSYTFPIFQTSDLLVFQNEIAATGFTVSGANTAGGGAVTFATPRVGGERIRLTRAVPIQRSIDLPATGPYSSEDIDREFDRTFAILQQQEGVIDRSVRVAPGEAGIELPLGPSRVNSVLGFDAFGNLSLVPLTAQLGGYLQAQRIEYIATAGQTVFTMSYTALAGYIDVHLNGVRLQNADYTHVGTTVTLAVAATLGDVVTLSGFINGSVSTGTFNFQQSGTGAVSRTAETKLRETVSSADFGTLQQAINSGAARVVLAADVTITADITLASNQILDFAGRKITVTSGATITNGVLYSSGGTNIALINPVIDASAKTGGCTGIKLFNVTGAQIDNARMTRCEINLDSTDNTIERNCFVRNAVVNMDGRLSTAIYVSGMRGVKIIGGTLYGGLEGVGLYNSCRYIDHIDITSYSHTQDGFVILAADYVKYVSCVGRNNGQSGFTSQSLGAAGQYVDWIGCVAQNNTADGFDIHGRAAAITTGFNLVSCTAINNGPTGGGCGFYILNAPGTSIDSCVAITNQFQGIFLNTSNNVIINGFCSISNANAIASGAAKTGIWIADSSNAQVIGCISKNDSGATQEYGVSFGGTSLYGRVIGGDYLNNSVAGFNWIAGNSIIGATVAAPANVLFKAISNNGLYDEESTVAPTHTRARGSVCRLAGGGTASNYYSQGGGSWSRYIPNQGAVASPAGGATIDAQARTAIDAIRTILTASGLMQ